MSIVSCVGIVQHREAVERMTRYMASRLDAYKRSVDMEEEERRKKIEKMREFRREEVENKNTIVQFGEVLVLTQVEHIVLAAKLNIGNHTIALITSFVLVRSFFHCQFSTQIGLNHFFRCPVVK